MDERRLYYLQAMGIQLWVRRAASAPPAPPPQAEILAQAPEVRPPADREAAWARISA